jgi:hypothetical protein
MGLSFSFVLSTALALGPGAVQSKSPSASCLARAKKLAPAMLFLSEAAALDLSAVSASCSDAQSEENSTTIAESDLLVRKDFGVLSKIIETQSKDFKIQFDSKLEDLRKSSKSAEVRIKEAYLLAAEASADFDARPAKSLLEKRHLYGRDAQRSAVVALAISRVRKTPSEYAVSLTTSYPFKSSSRTWVRVRRSQTGLSGVTEFDLDISRHGNQFVPVKRRFVSLSKTQFEEIKKSCDQLMSCLAAAAAANESPK